MQAHPAIPYMEVWVSGKYYVVFDKGLKHPQIFLSEGGSWNQSPWILRDDYIQELGTSCVPERKYSKQSTMVGVHSRNPTAN